MYCDAIKTCACVSNFSRSKANISDSFDGKRKIERVTIRIESASANEKKVRFAGENSFVLTKRRAIEKVIVTK